MLTRAFADHTGTYMWGPTLSEVCVHLLTIGNKNCGIKGNLDSIEFPIGGFVPIGVIKLIGGSTDATESECVEVVIVETDT